MSVSRSFRPSEIKKIREELQKELQQRMNPKAEEIARQYQEQIVPRTKEGFTQLPSEFRAHGRQSPTVGTIAPLGTLPGQPATIPGIPG